MKISIEKGGDYLTINQRYYSSILILFIRITGIILFISGGAGLAVILPETAENAGLTMSLFSGDLLTSNIIFSIGLAMTYAGFSDSVILRYKEKLLFRNDPGVMELYTAESATSPFIISYDEISGIESSRQIISGQKRQIYSLYLNLYDGAVFWVTGNEPDENKVKQLADEISMYSGIPLSGRNPVDNANSRLGRHISHKLISERGTSRYLLQNDTADGTIFRLRKKRITLPAMVFAAYLYLSLILIPFFLMNIFLDESIPDAVHYALYIFIILWWGILLISLVISMRDFTIKVNDSGITVTVQPGILSMLKKQVFIPRGSIRSIMTSRYENGICTLSVGLTELSGNIKPFTGILFNASVLRSGKSTGSQPVNKNILNLWELQPQTANDSGPTIHDLKFIEDFAGKKLVL